MIIEIIIFIIMILYAWIASFTLHELFHIKSQGLSAEGKINVYKNGMTCIADKVKNEHLYELSGGLYSGILHIIIGLCAFYYSAWPIYVPMITLGMINLTYGFWERYKGPELRYKIYLWTLSAMIVFWLIYFSW